VIEGAVAVSFEEVAVALCFARLERVLLCHLSEGITGNPVASSIRVHVLLDSDAGEQVLDDGAGKVGAAPVVAEAEVATARAAALPLDQVSSTGEIP